MLARLFTTRFSKGAVENKSLLPGFLLPAVVVAIALLPGAGVFAQQVDGDFEGEKTWTTKAGEEREIKAPSPKDKNRGLINKLLADGKLSAESDDDAFQGWAQYYVRSLTWKDNLTNLPGARKELKKQLLRIGKAPSGDLHARLNDLALTVLSEVALDPRYPRAVRYNCMLALGELDERDQNSNTGEKPIPLPAASSVMLKTAADNKQQLAVRLAAVLGLRRPIQLGFAAPLQGQLADTLLGVLKAPVSEGNDQVGQIWLRLVAADLLQSMIHEKIAVDQTKLATALAGHIADEKLPTWARAKLAGDLGRLDGRALPAGQLAPTVRSLASFMLAITQASPFAQDEEAEADGDKKDAGVKGAEKKRSEKNDETTDAPATPEAASPTVQKLSSEETIWQLSQIRLALFGKDAPVGKADGPSDEQGLQMAADDASKAAMKKMVGRIDELVKLLAGVPNNLPELAEKLRGANDDLQDILSSAAAGQAQTAKGKKAGTALGAPPKGNAPAGASTVTP
jgi:hypothetical protein